MSLSRSRRGARWELGSRRALVPALALAALVAGFGAQPILGPATASAGPVRTAEPGDGPLVRKDPASATSTARATGRRVEDLSQGDGYNFVYAEPDGTWTVETASQPVRAKDESGAWADVDTDLVERSGRLEPKNVSGDITLSAGGDRAFAKVDPAGDGTSEDLAWEWATALPEPVINGPTATYPGAVPGGDLVVTATSTGFTHNVVLNEPPAPGAAPVEITVPVTTPEAEIRETSTGGLEIKDVSSGKKVATAAAPVMWDSSAVTRTSPDPSVEPVDTEVVDTPTGGEIVLTPDENFLTDPDTVYPVTIDPTFVVDQILDTWIMNAGYTSSQSNSIELRAGTYDNGTHLARSFLKFAGDSQWAGKEILSAALVVRNFSSTSCDAGAIRAYRITESWSSTSITWANQPTATSNGYAQYSPAHGGGTDCPQADATFSVTGIVKDWVAGDPNYGIRLAAATETNPNSWRRYRSVDYDVEQYRPWLKVNYNSYPSTAYEPSATPLVGAVPQGGTEMVYTTSTRTPTVSAKAADVDLDNVAITMRAYAAADLSSEVLGQCTTPLGASDTELSCVISSLPNNATVYLRGKAADENDAWAGKTFASASGWTSWRPIKVNAPAADPVVQQIIELDTGTTEDEVIASINELVASSPDPLTFDQAKVALLEMLSDNDDEVTEDSEDAQDVVQGIEPEPADAAPADLPPLDDPSDPLLAEDPTTPDAPSKDEVAVNDTRYAAAAGFSSPGGPTGGERIWLPKPRYKGDIVYAPNKSEYRPHGHAAIFSNSLQLIEAIESGVREVYRWKYRSFAAGAKMMWIEIPTDDGVVKAPLIMRKKAVDWARSRVGDRYRAYSSPNAKVVSGPVGSSGSKQNCSQLVWAAYKLRGMDMNDVGAIGNIHPGAYWADKQYVLPRELLDSKFTHVYNTVYKNNDGQSVY